MCQVLSDIMSNGGQAAFLLELLDFVKQVNNIAWQPFCQTLHLATQHIYKCLNSGCWATENLSLADKLLCVLTSVGWDQLTLFAPQKLRPLLPFETLLPHGH